MNVWLNCSLIPLCGAVFAYIPKFFWFPPDDLCSCYTVSILCSTHLNIPEITFLLWGPTESPSEMLLLVSPRAPKTDAQNSERLFCSWPQFFEMRVQRKPCKEKRHRLHGPCFLSQGKDFHRAARSNSLETISQKLVEGQTSAGVCRVPAPRAGSHPACLLSEALHCTPHKCSLLCEPTLRHPQLEKSLHLWGLRAHDCFPRTSLFAFLCIRVYAFRGPACGTRENSRLFAEILTC